MRRSTVCASRAAASQTRVRAVPAATWWQQASSVALPAPLVLSMLCTNAADGTLEDFDEAGAGSGGNKKETAEEAAARVKLQAAQARAAVK